MTPSEVVAALGDALSEMSDKDFSGAPGFGIVYSLERLRRVVARSPAQKDHVKILVHADLTVAGNCLSQIPSLSEYGEALLAEAETLEGSLTLDPASPFPLYLELVGTLESMANGPILDMRRPCNALLIATLEAQEQAQDVVGIAQQVMNRAKAQGEPWIGLAKKYAALIGALANSAQREQALAAAVSAK